MLTILIHIFVVINTTSPQYNTSLFGVKPLIRPLNFPVKNFAKGVLCTSINRFSILYTP